MLLLPADHGKQLLRIRKQLASVVHALAGGAANRKGLNPGLNPVEGNTGPGLGRTRLNVHFHQNTVHLELLYKPMVLDIDKLKSVQT